MTEKKKRNERFVSPKGRFVYPWLTTPDTKFDPEGVYRLKLAVPATEAAAVVEGLETKWAEILSTNEAGVTKESTKPWSLDEATNEFLLSFKMKAVVTTREGETWKQRPSIFDAAGLPCTDLKIGGGTMGRVSYEIIPYANAAIGAGLSLRLKAVQIIDLVEFGSADAGDYGFESEDGFETAPAEVPFDGDQAEGAAEAHDF